MSELKNRQRGRDGAPADTAAPASPGAVPERQDPSPPADDYKVGPGRPPKETRFTTGVSGNPSGRRKREDTFWEIFGKVAYGKVPIKDRGALSRIEVVVTQLFAEAMKGDKRARRDCLELMVRYSPPPPPSNDNAEASAEHHRAVIEAFLEGVRSKHPSPPGGEDDE